MKKLILIVILSMSFLACEKQNVTPEKQLLTIEVYAFPIDSILMNLEFNLSGEEINYSESKKCTSIGQSIVFKKDFYVTQGKVVNLEITGNESNIISISAYTDPGKSSFKFYKSPVKIKLIDNAFKNVIIE